MKPYEVWTLVLGGIGIAAGIVTVLVYYRQLRAMQASLEQQRALLEQQQDSLENQLVMQRRELYSNMTTSLTADEVNAMMLHVADHFNIDVYKQRYEGNDKRVWSYLLMKRKYLYLVLSTSFRTSKDDPAGSAPLTWLNELIEYREFLDVHASQAKYYPKFAALVDDKGPKG